MDHYFLHYIFLVLCPNWFSKCVKPGWSLGRWYEQQTFTVLVRIMFWQCHTRFPICHCKSPSKGLWEEPSARLKISINNLRTLPKYELWFSVWWKLTLALLCAVMHDNVDNERSLLIYQCLYHTHNGSFHVVYLNNIKASKLNFFYLSHSLNQESIISLDIDINSFSDYISTISLDPCTHLLHSLSGSEIVIILVTPSKEKDMYLDL